jgi:hypothetical protein
VYPSANSSSSRESHFCQEFNVYSALWSSVTTLSPKKLTVSLDRHTGTEGEDTEILVGVEKKFIGFGDEKSLTPLALRKHDGIDALCWALRSESGPRTGRRRGKTALKKLLWVGLTVV